MARALWHSVGRHLCLGKLATDIQKSLETGSTQIDDISEIEGSSKTGKSEIWPKTDLYDPILMQDRNSRGPIRSRDRERARKAYLSRQISVPWLGRSLQYYGSKSILFLGSFKGKALIL